MSYIRLSYDETTLIEFYGSKLKIKTHFTTNKPTHPFPISFFILIHYPYSLIFKQHQISTPYSPSPSRFSSLSATTGPVFPFHEQPLQHRPRPPSPTNWHQQQHLAWPLTVACSASEQRLVSVDFGPFFQPVLVFCTTT